MTTPDIIRSVAVLAAKDLACRADMLNITRAVCWAVHGCECLPREMLPSEALYVAEVLDDIEDGLGMTVAQYERTHVDAEPAQVADDLIAVAEMLPGGTAWPRDIWEK